MLKTRSMRRKVFATAATFIGATAAAAAIAVPAGASLPTSGSTSIITAGGSNTAYTTMQQMSDLYNSSPGCNLLNSGTPQQLNYSCPSSPQDGAENGYKITTSQNPYNDVAYQLPAMGSTNGIAELKEQSNPPGGVSVTPINYARSSRAPNSSDPQGLNFVGYAEDAVPWFHFTKYNNAATPSANISDISSTQLTGIYNGTITNWNQVCDDVTGHCGSNAPIALYIAQNGSGTEDTWATDLGLKSGTFPYGGENPATHVIFENEDSSIIANGDGANAIFFFSFGKFSLLCPKGVCAGTPSSLQKNTVAALGGINGVVANQSSITGKCVGSKKACKKNPNPPLFFTDRKLYNVYADGSQGASVTGPAGTQATMNFVSTWGFLCSTQAHNTVDPLSPTEQTYGAEMASIITSQGFFTVPLGAMGDNTSGVVKPSFADAFYQQSSPNPGSSDQGYCRVTSTNP
jgi:ABC-type phosphate transport system substrate-binding protein